MVTFNIPRQLRDVEIERQNELGAATVPALNKVDPGDVEAAYHDCISALADGALNILDQDTFDAAFTTIRSLELLDAGSAAKLAGTMSENLRVLVTSGLEELSAESRDKSDPVIVAHRSAIHAHAFFLHHLHESVHMRALESQKAEAGVKAAAPKKRGGKAKAATRDNAEDGLTAAWPAVVERVMKVLSRTLKASLDDVLYRTPVDKCRLVEICIMTAARCMEDTSIAKQKAALSACLDVAALSASKHSNANGCLDLTAEALFQLVMEHDHGGGLALQAAALAAEQHESSALAKALINKFCEREPEEYDEIAGRDTKPVKRAAEMLSHMAASMPSVLHAGISQLMPYFGCKVAVTIRSNLVACMGKLMEWYMARGMDQKCSRQLQMSRQNAVQTLVSRANDMHALVRKAALDNIEHLASGKLWPLEYIVLAARAAVARLDDGALAAGAALGLLCALVHVACQDKLRDTSIRGVKSRLEEWLKGMQPDVVEDGEEEPGPQWEASGWGDAGGDVQPSQQQLYETSSQQQGITLPTQLNDGAGDPPPRQGQGPVAAGQDADVAGDIGSGMTYSQLRMGVAMLNELLGLSKTLEGALPEVEVLLASDSVDVAKEAIKLLTLCSQKQLQGVTESWRRVWHLVFSTSEKVRETVLDAFYNFLMPSTGRKTELEEQDFMLNSLMAMVKDLALCDLEALEELMRLAVTSASPDKGPMLKPELVKRMLWKLHDHVSLASTTEGEGGKDSAEPRALAAQLSVLCGMVARHAPKLIVQDAKHLVNDLQSSHVILKDAFLVRNLARMLADIAPALHASARGGRGVAGGYQPAAYIPNALSSLLSVLVSGYLPERGGAWPAAAQAAVAAIYRLHPEPHQLLKPLMQHLAGGLVGGRAPATQIARAVFLVGCIATQQLALIDSLAKRIRQERAVEEKKVAEKASSDDMDAQLGTGQAREHHLDALQEELEARLMEGGSLVSMWGSVVSGLCRSPALLTASPELASAAMTTLAKFMVLDAEYCEDSCPLFFTRLTAGNIKLEAGVRCSMLVALGDLGRRHPNVVEPWTERIFVCLNDEDEEVATTCLRILAHLILSDMTKPKGHMAHVARCLVSRSAAVRDLAIRLFNSLSSKQAKGGANKVHQYLPEIISAVTRGEPMAEQDFKAMMQRLLGYVKVDKLADSLKVRLCERFENVVCEPAMGAAAPVDGAAAAGLGTSSANSSNGGSSSSTYEELVREWRSLADCIALLPYSEKGLRACMERLKCYKHALGDEHVYKVFKEIAEHGRRGKRTDELKQEVTEYEARLLEAHVALKEEQLQQAAAAAAARAAAAEVAAAAAARTVAAAGRPDVGEKQQQADAEEGDQGVGGAAGDAGNAAAEAPFSATGENVSRGAGDGARNDAPGNGHGGRMVHDADEDEDMVSAGEEGGEEDGVDEGKDAGDVRDTAAGQQAGQETEQEDTTYEEAADESADEEVQQETEQEETQYEEAPDESAEEEVQQNGQQEVGGSDEEYGTPDVDMEWDGEEGTEAGTPHTPQGGSAGRGGDGDYDDVTATPESQVGGTAMAITPLELRYLAAEQASPRDDMAWSPAPQCAAGTAPALAPTVAGPPAATGPTLRENVMPGQVPAKAFPGFRIKAEPDASQAGGLQGAAWPLRGVVGVRVKPDPDGPLR